MNDDVRELAARIHESPAAVALVLTGGGVAAPAWLLGVPGGSRTVVEVAVPYAQEAFDDYLVASPASYCSPEAAVRLARRARQRATWLAPGRKAVGVACTASLRSDRPKRGDHRAHVAVATAEIVAVWSLTFVKEARSREQEDAVASRLVLNALAYVLETDVLPLGLLPGEEVTFEREPGPTLLPPGRTSVCVEPDGRVRVGGPTPPLVLPGSFNPLHHGHLGMMAAAAKHLGMPAAFEISAVNVEKPNLGEDEMRRRAVQFAWRAPVWFTRAPTFPLKAEAFPGAVFLLGADTAARVLQERFYANMLWELEGVRQRGCRFLVAGRVEASGAFVGLDDLAIPDSVRDLFDELPGFRLDVSSTMLRG